VEWPRALPKISAEKVRASSATGLNFRPICTSVYFCGIALRRGERLEPGLKDAKRAVFGSSISRVPVIDLESAAFVFHINGTTQGITGSLRAACSEPVQRFLACPFS
jgi:hypothetical protein